MAYTLQGCARLLSTSVYFPNAVALLFNQVRCRNFPGELVSSWSWIRKSLDIKKARLEMNPSGLYIFCAVGLKRVPYQLDTITPRDVVRIYTKKV